MEYTIKYGVFRYTVYDKNGNAAGTVCRDRSSGARLTVNDAAGRSVCRLYYRDGKIELEDADGIRTYGLFASDPSGRGCGSAPAFTRPPMAEEAEVESGCGRIRVCQTRKREFRIYLNGKEAGRMTHMMHFTKKLTLPESFPRQYAGLVFAVGIVMLHADDVELV